MNNLEDKNEISNNQYGGKKGIPYKLKLSDEFIQNDPNIATIYYEDYISKTFDYWKISKFDNIINLKAILYASNFSNNINTYDFVIPHINWLDEEYKDSNTSDINETKIEELLDKNNPHISIIKFKAYGKSFFHDYELISNYMLLDKSYNSEIDILELSNSSSLSFNEACNYYNKQHNLSKFNYDLDYFISIIFDWKETPQYKTEQISNAIKNKKINLNIIKKFFNRYIIKDNNKKYDLIVCNILTGSRTLLRPHINTYLYFNQYIYSLFRLKLEGHLIIGIMQVITKAMADLIVMISHFFEDTYIHYFEVHNKYKWSAVYIIHKNFKGITNTDKEELLKIFDELYKYDPTGIKFNIKNEEIRKKFRIFKEIDPNFEYKYINSFLNTNSSDKIYDKIRRKNTQIYIDKIIHMEKLIELIRMNKKDQEKRIEKYKKAQIANSILYAKKYGFETIKFSNKNIDEIFAKIITQDIFSYHHSITYNFNFFPEHWEMIVIPQNKFDQVKRKTNMIKFLIDTQDMEELMQIKKYVKYYRPQNNIVYLTKSIDINFNTGFITEEWLIMYNIINNFNLLPNKKNLKTFHVSKASLEDVRAINHYIKTKTSNILDWKAYSTGRSDFTEKYNNRVFVNKDVLSTMLNETNIKLYNKYTKDVDLITCNIYISGLNEQEKIETQLEQTVFILNNLPIGSNFVAKYSINQTSKIQISMIYLLYESFDKLIFYKDNVNQYSKKFYIIGKGYKGVSNHILDELFKKINKLDKESNIEIELYPMNFIYQLIQILNKLSNYYCFNIDRQMYYINYYENISDKYKELINEEINKRNKDFIEKINLEKINSKDKL